MYSAYLGVHTVPIPGSMAVQRYTAVPRTPPHASETRVFSSGSRGLPSAHLQRRPASDFTNNLSLGPLAAYSRSQQPLSPTRSLRALDLPAVLHQVKPFSRHVVLYDPVRLQIFSPSPPSFS